MEYFGYAVHAHVQYSLSSINRDCPENENVPELAVIVADLK